MRQVYIAFYLSIVLGFLRAIFRKILTFKVDHSKTAKYFLLTTDYHDSSICIMVGKISNPPNVHGWQEHICNRFVNENGFKEILGTMIVRSQDLVGITNEEINSPESPYSDWMNERLERAALKLAREYTWFKPTIFHDSNFPE
jgi:hypothetical protein